MTELVKGKRKFAWGCNVWGESVCPSLAAFPEAEQGRFSLVGNPGLYDDLVRAFLGESQDEEDLRAFNDTQGEISEELAKAKWLSALREMEIGRGNEEIIKEHRLVAEKLGWLERDHTNTTRSEQ